MENDEEPDYSSKDKYTYGIVGEAQTNPDGTNRQEILSKCKAGDKVQLIREPENEFDYHAIAVRLSDGRQIGWVPKSTNLKLAFHIDVGGKVDASIYKITGGPGFLGRIFKPLAKHYGCLIKLTYGTLDDVWSLIEPLQKRSEEIQGLIGSAKDKEKEHPDEAIALYQKAIDEIKAMDATGPAAVALRGARYPINRMSLVMQRQNRYQDALDAIHQYENYKDKVGLVSSDDEAIEKRKIRLSSKLK